MQKKGLMLLENNKTYSCDMSCYSAKVSAANSINPGLYAELDVKRGLRDLDGRGVLAGLTRIGDVRSYLEEDGASVPQPGQLFYRGLNIYDLVNGFAKEGASASRRRRICCCSAICRTPASWIPSTGSWRRTGSCRRNSCGTSSWKRPAGT